MARRWRPRRRPVRRVTEQSRALAQARRVSRFSAADIGRALGLHGRTVTRWEIGESTPKDSIWPRLLAFYATHAPQAAQALATAVGRPLPAIRTAATADRALAGQVVARTADVLDVAPRRVREVLLAAARAATESGMGYEGLMRSVVLDAEVASAARRPDERGPLAPD